MLIVPEEAIFKKASVIAFAHEDGENALRDDLKMFKDFKDVFEAKVYVVKIITEGDTKHLMFTENEAEERYLDISFEYPEDSQNTAVHLILTKKMPG